MICPTWPNVSINNMPRPLLLLPHPVFHIESKLGFGDQDTRSMWRRSSPLPFPITSLHLRLRLILKSQATSRWGCRGAPPRQPHGRFTSRHVAEVWWGHNIRPYLDTGLQLDPRPESKIQKKNSRNRTAECLLLKVTACANWVHNDWHFYLPVDLRQLYVDLRWPRLSEIIQHSTTISRKSSRRS